MRTADFDYHLPVEYIAQTPIEPRHAARLLVMRRSCEELEHSTFWEIGQHLLPGDVLVINQTRVIPARLYARKNSGGRVELLLLRRVNEHAWEALVGGKRLVAGKRLQIEAGPEAEIVAALDGSRRLIKFCEPIEPYLQRVGKMPLPPYIHAYPQDPQRYQTVYASSPGSVAAPTAGLHFTPELMQRLEAQGVEFIRVTLHVGLDTFAPVTEEDAQSHPIHSEWCEVTPHAAERVNEARRGGRRIIAVGTTSVRTLETAAQYAAPGETVAAFCGETRLFILPGYAFRAVDGMITNFHLPRSTLLMMVSAFAGRERVLNAYHCAMQAGYRFYSFGDAMLIL